ncbi:MULTISPECIES: O-antigen ligase [unclassified Ensifer]|uniref:O-antigen ligase family protein n=1 Tax=unclassified Ensifer TaxID=2633371 RepID=UPI00070E3DC1|nr:MULTISPECIES: O-antigen ligase [unclassified Ensifer]KQW60633.1 exopolysaccharide biosynthesis protein [Ensifer sp. Root1252]KQW73872.1 exopolysaccharide biosynthesis protein [Ensifer sp. Root127]KRC79462.1 exopolysaccharide biosynthesis protein [Ensifer sp. Root231]KRC99854.1 exopolysaccharide biosynthesis protein [Ensifer sp. Root258]
MRISKASLVSPGANQTYGTFALAISFFVFAYSSRFGQASILVYYALWLPLVLVDYRSVLGNYGRYIWILAFAVFACLSVFWSAAPGMTARTGVQYLSHVVCALIAMRTIDIRTLVRGALAGVGIVLTYSLLFGVYHLDPLDGTFSFVGAFSSKNQLGFYASLGIYFAFIAPVALRERGLWLAAAGAVGLISAYSLLASQSATSVLTAVAIVGCWLGMRAVGMLSPGHRKGLFLGAVVVGGITAVAATYGGGVDLVLGLFGKDSTLTGRTYLWQQGIQAALSSPVVGVGYQAYWVQGFSEPERLWEEFFIATRSGFHFHNTFIEAMVETGAIGLVLLCNVLLVTVFGHIKRLLAYDHHTESSVLFGVAMLLFVRAFVEIDIMNPYHVGSFLLYFAAGKLTIRQGRRVVTERRLAEGRVLASHHPQLRF